jgi:hypothetical protein
MKLNFMTDHGSSRITARCARRAGAAAAAPLRLGRVSALILGCRAGFWGLGGFGALGAFGGLLALFSTENGDAGDFGLSELICAGYGGGTGELTVAAPSPEPEPGSEPAPEP